MTSHSRKVFGRTGFTLIELLVVIGVISVLAALLFPVFAQAKRSAKATACLSNLKQLGAAFSLYAGDNGESLPNGSDGRPGFGLEASSPRLVDQMMSYVTNIEVFRCPADVGSDTMDTDYGVALGGRPTVFVKDGTSYFYQFTGLWPMSVPLSEMEKPSESGVMWDGSGAWHTGNGLVPAHASYDQWFKGMQQYRYNTLYGDWHAKFEPRDAWLTARL